MNSAVIAPRAPSPDGRARSILIVDDDRDFADSLADSLELQGYSVKTVYDAEAALAAVQEYTVQVALLDIRLQHDNGIDLIPRVHETQPDVLCVMVTANADLGSAVDSLRSGAYDYLKKPLQNEELTAVLDRCFQIARLRQEKAAAEAAQYLSEARFRATFDHAGVGIALISADGRLDEANREFCEITGRSGAALHDRTFLDLVHPDDQENEIAQLKALTEGTVDRHRSEIRYVRRDGSTIWVNSTVSPVLNAARELTGCVLVVEDFTARRESEERLRRAQGMEAVGRLTGGLAHDFNNLLTVVLGNLELVLDALDEKSPQRKGVLASIGAAERGAALIEQLLSFSRKQLLRPEIADLNALVGGMVELMHRALGEAYQIKFTAGEGLRKIRVDATQLESALLNIAINARDAMPGGGRIVIETANADQDQVRDDAGEEIAPGAYVVLSVTDHGAGMTDATLKRAFEPFFTTKEVGEGSGLGLSMAYGFARQSNGYAWISSKRGTGTMVSLFLPAVDDGAATENH